MPKDNEVDEKVVAFQVRRRFWNGAPWSAWETFNSPEERDASIAPLIGSEWQTQFRDLSDAATVAELRAEVEKYRLAYAEYSERTEWVQDTAAPHELGKHRADVLRQRIEAANNRADAAERRAGELEAVLRRISTMNAADDSDYGFNEWGEADCFNQVRVLAAEALTGADPT